jgi:hypothetical protein
MKLYQLPNGSQILIDEDTDTGYVPVSFAPANYADMIVVEDCFNKLSSAYQDYQELDLSDGLILINLDAVVQYGGEKSSIASELIEKLQS